MSDDPIKENSSGFPNPALDGQDLGLDLNELVVKHPASTFYMRVEGEEYAQAGIYSGDIVVLDRSLEARAGNTVLVTTDGQMKIVELPKNADDFAQLESTDIWGVITHVVSPKR